MKRPSVDASLQPLKPFQRRTVEHAFRRLFTAPGGTGRFLVADEVGLGKTLVARGIIARAVEHLWDDVERIDVVYICSNASIARANLPKLSVGGATERPFVRTTRLTMLATELAPREGEPGLAGSKLNFVSFTPGTSFNMGHSSGQGRERVVLFHLLAPLPELQGQRTALMNLLQGGITKRDTWRAWLNDPLPLDADISRRFGAAFRERPDLQDTLRELLHTFRRYRDWPPEARARRNGVIADLRRVLADAGVGALEPDLVILDEFQRFKSLIDAQEAERNPAAELARKLFRARAHDGEQVRTLLLSATPYKPYTTDAEIDHEEHHEDFLATTRFLLGDDEARVDDVRGRLSRFGEALRRAAAGEPDQVQRVEREKRAVEAALRDVMARTERVAASENRDAMVAEDRCKATVAAGDVRQYAAADALFRAVGDRDPMPFWKSAPYLAHFMHGYKFDERLNEAIEAPETPETLVEALRRHDSAFLKSAELHKWSPLDPGHARLRALASELLDTGLWRLLWMPPTVPYWPPEGPFEGREQATKRLLFSAWNVAPDAVSAVLSYEAERRMTAGRVTDYEHPDQQQRPLLRLAQTASGERSRQRLLLLLLPCLPLADRAHPLAAPAGRDRRAWVRERVDELLSSLPDPPNGPVDERWEWAAPLLLDPALRAFLRGWRGWGEDGRLRRPDGKPFEPPNPDVFGAYVDDLLALDPQSLGRRPAGLAELLTEVALGSPAVLASRCLRAGTGLDDDTRRRRAAGEAAHDDHAGEPGIDDDTRRRLAVTIADAFWSLFNRPAVIALLRGLGAERRRSEPGGRAGAPDRRVGAGNETARDEAAYWRLVLRYCRQGNLQAVLDEQWHLLWEQASWSEDADTAARCARQLAQVVHPTRARVHARLFRTRRDVSGPAVETEEMRIRTVFAVRFGRSRTDDGDHVSQDEVRAAFNSPFRPFVLASTSIGQEGLDFHPWCHRLVHWNLPGNPVDLEQREGRVHRYKGHAVRRNVAAAHADDALRSWRAGDDLWTLIFERADQAARAERRPDLEPHWIAPGRHRVERHVLQLPYTAEAEAFERLKRRLAAYRVVLGQPRQEELLALLDRADLDARIRNWAVDLSPPSG